MVDVTFAFSGTACVAFVGCVFDIGCVVFDGVTCVAFGCAERGAVDLSLLDEYRNTATAKTAASPIPIPINDLLEMANDAL